MSREGRTRAFAIVGENEGGWADDKRDRGGLTRWGVSSKNHPDVDLDKLHTFEDAIRVVYAPRYWDPIQGDKLPTPVDLAVLDFAVHSGVRRASRALQKATGPPKTWPAGKRWVDGRIGLATTRRLNWLVNNRPGLRNQHPRQARDIAWEVNRIRIRFLANGFRRGIFVDGEQTRQGELVYLYNFMRRTARIGYEIGRG